MKKLLSVLGGVLLFLAPVVAQQTDAEYRKVIYGRSEKIVETLGIEDTTVRHRILETIATQYIELGVINDNKDLSDEQRDAKLRARHYWFIGALEADLNADQMEKVKDGMTMGVYPKTYQAHLEMIPTLTEEQKAYIRLCLKEAREYAMDCSDSKAKHAWFGKYKGRINNYLSKQGYDLAKEREAWNERIKAAQK